MIPEPHLLILTHAAAIAAGIIITLVGFAVHRAHQRRNRERDPIGQRLNPYDPDAIRAYYIKNHYLS